MNFYGFGYLNSCHFYNGKKLTVFDTMYGKTKVVAKNKNKLLKIIKNFKIKLDNNFIKIS
jgi:hypothetical protein